MTIEIKKSTKVAEFQASFQQLYPFLKPVFFHNSLDDVEGSWSEFSVLNTQTTFAELSDNVPAFTQTIVLNREMTIGGLEGMMYQQYGLVMRIFRKYLGDWSETCLESHTTLEYCNAIGEAHNYETEEVYL